jgi:hypothetical protein
MLLPSSSKRTRCTRGLRGCEDKQLVFAVKNIRASPRRRAQHARQSRQARRSRGRRALLAQQPTAIGRRELEHRRTLESTPP